MGRKRLLTILTAVIVGVGVPAGAASAQSLPVPGVGEVGVSDDCAEADLSVGELEVDGDLCVTEDGVELRDDSEVAGTDSPVKKVTEPVEEVTEKVTEPLRKSTGGGDAGTDEPDTSSGGDAGGAAGGEVDRSRGGDGSGTNSERVTSDEREDRRRGQVAAAGDAEPISTEDAQRQHRLASIRALRSDLSGGRDLGPGVAGPVVPFGDLGLEQAESPLVADEGGIAPAFDGEESFLPEIAPTEQAILASQAPAPDLAEVPLALQLLAGALVLGAGAVWTLARREVGADTTTTA
ncbi:MAG: hypothetical protein WEB09_06960 [Nitriliruptor sp.]